jgi:hypothetical protein
MEDVQFFSVCTCSSEKNVHGEKLGNVLETTYGCPSDNKQKKKCKSVDVIYPTVIIVGVSVKRYPNFLFSGFCIIGRVPVHTHTRLRESEGNVIEPFLRFILIFFTRTCDPNQDL